MSTAAQTKLTASNSYLCISSLWHDLSQASVSSVHHESYVAWCSQPVHHLCQPLIRDCDVLDCCCTQILLLSYQNELVVFALWWCHVASVHEDAREARCGLGAAANLHHATAVLSHLGCPPGSLHRAQIGWGTNAAYHTAIHLLYSAAEWFA